MHETLSDGQQSDERSETARDGSHKLTKRASRGDDRYGITSTQ